MKRELVAALAQALGSPVASARRVSGGDINDAYRVDLEDGRRAFVKTHPDAPRGLYPSEARGLDWIDEAGALRTPARYAVGDGDARFLALEWIEPGPRARNFDERFGEGLARLHRAGAPQFGLDADNFIGPLPQPNAPRPTWAEFYGARRLAVQIERANRARLLPRESSAQLDVVLSGLADLVGPAEPPARLHGDLWSGNVYSDASGQPCLIDPAVYGGHREVDLAMLQLFGSPSPQFFSAYERQYPLAPGWNARVPLYQLYPLLVHVNLFGAGYLARLQRCVAEVLHQTTH